MVLPMTKRSQLALILALLTAPALLACTEAETDSETVAQEDGTDTEEDGTDTEAEALLTAADLVGDWASAGCESYPDGMGGENHLTRSFSLDEQSWRLDLALFGDPDCSFPLFSVAIDGPYTLGEASPVVEGATEGDFGFAKIVWTAEFEDLAELFTANGCGTEPWVVGEPQDVSDTGCIGVAHPIASCPTDHDIVALDGDALYFGERITDMCAPEGRPAALNAYSVVRQ
jgi:hypothetical protein